MPININTKKERFPCAVCGGATSSLTGRCRVKGCKGMRAGAEPQPVLHDLATWATIPARPMIDKITPGGVDRDQIARNAEAKRKHIESVSHETPDEVSREEFGPFDPNDLPVCPACAFEGQPFNQLRIDPEGDIECSSCWKIYPKKEGGAA